MTTVQTTRRQVGKERGQPRSGLMAILVTLTLIGGPMGLGSDDLVPSASAATSHAPIHVLDDEDLAAQAQTEGWPGSGTATDPYIISGYDIEATSGPAIRIDGTRKHLVIEDNIVDADLSHHGIWINRSHNVQVRDNQVQRASFGIFADGGLNVHIARNDVADSFWGILLLSSTRSTVTENAVHGNQNGIVAVTAWDVGVDDNQAHDNSMRGIYLDDLRESRVRDNLALRNAETGIHVRGSHGNLLQGNEVHDNPTGLLSEDAHDNQLLANRVSGATTGVRLLRTTDTTVANGTITGSTTGLYLDHSGHNLLAGNHVEGGTNGYRFLNAHHHRLEHNTANGTTTGMRFWNSFDHAVHNHTATNSTTGILVDVSGRIHIANGTFRDNGVGIRLASARDVVARDNHLAHNGEGVVVRFGLDHLVRSNHIVDNGIGIHLHITKRNTIFDNVFENTENVRKTDAEENTWNVAQTAGPNIIGGAYLGGNHWHDYNGIDLNTDGIGDVAHTFVPPVSPVIDATLRNQGLVDGPKDQLPLVRSTLVLGGT